MVEIQSRYGKAKKKTGNEKKGRKTHGNIGSGDNEKNYTRWGRSLQLEAAFGYGIPWEW